MVVSGSQQALEPRGPRSHRSRQPGLGRGAGLRRRARRAAAAGRAPRAGARSTTKASTSPPASRGARTRSAVYVTPSHQYPLGVTMSASRRLQLLDWARRSGAWIIEDDYDSEYRYESQPIASLQGLDRDARVLYVGTFSKVLFPALRLGYLVLPAGPRASLRRRPRRDGHLPADVRAGGRSPTSSARGTSRGTCGGMRRSTASGAARSSTRSATELGERARGARGRGRHAPGRDALRGRRDDREVAVRAARQGLWAMPLSSCYVGRPSRRGFVLGFGGTDVGRDFRRSPEAGAPHSRGEVGDRRGS